MNALTTATGALAFVLASAGTIAAAVVLFAVAILLVVATPYTQRP